MLLAQVLFAVSFALQQAEFAKYYRAITGAEAQDGAVSFAIDAKVSSSGKDAYAIKSEGTGVRITGSNERSTWYGLYDLLERRGGCHWFWDGDVVPKRASIDLAGLDVREEAQFEYRGLRYFAHRGLTRFQAEHWGFADWKKEIDWCLKRRLNVFMLRIGQDDLFQRAFPGTCAYPDPSKDLPGHGKGYDNRTLFWSLQYRGKLRQDLQKYAFARGLLVPEDFGTMTHWYSRTPEDYLDGKKPSFLPQSTAGYSEKNGLVWDIRDPKWVDEYWKLTTTACDAYGKGRDQELLHTIGLGERRCFKDRKDNHELKKFALKQFLDRADRDYPKAKRLLAGWDFYFTWHPDEVRDLVSRLDPARDIIWDYEGDATCDYRPEMRDIGGNNFTKWGVCNRFPYTFSVFLAFEDALDIRANYPLIEERQRIVQNDPACAGFIFWPEASHTDTLLLRYFTANAWTKGGVPSARVLDEFCASRYGASAGKLKPIWQKVIPMSYLRDWGENYAKDVVKHEAWMEANGWSGTPANRYNDSALWMDKEIPSSLRSAPEVFRALAGLDWKSTSFVERDAIDLARTAADRLISSARDRLLKAYHAWKTGRGSAADVGFRAAAFKTLGRAMADLLALHTDYSLAESYDRLTAVEPVANPNFPNVLVENATSDYCASHQYEAARYWYEPAIRDFADLLVGLVAKGDRSELKDLPAFGAYRDAHVFAKTLAEMRPRLPRTQEQYVKTLRTLAQAAEDVFRETDAPHYENRWVFALQYLNTDLELTQTKALIRRAKTAGYNGLAIISGRDYTSAGAKTVSVEGALACRAAYTGLEDVELMEPARLARFRDLKRFCDAEKFDFVPLVWSTGYCSMQYADPNFTACWPVRDVPYLVKGGRASFAAEPVPVDVSPFNRTFDCTAKGADRVSVRFAVKPCRRYRLSTCVKVDGVLRKSVYGGVGPTYGVLTKSCDSGQFSSSHHDDFESVQDWTESGFTFATGEEDDEATLCCRVDGCDTGRILIRGAKVEELGIEYPVRRAGTRFEVRDAATGRLYREGVDYAAVPAVDLLRHGRRERPLELEILASGAIADGARLLVSAWEPKSVYGNQFTACFTNPALRDYYRRSARGLARELGVTKWFMSADEIRVGCRCENCMRDADVAGVRIGKDYRAQYDAIREVCPDADIYMWPDMANINHNATDKYYLMRTTTKGALDFVPTDVTMVSWWGTKAPINLPYYTARGYRTMGAGYYDVQDVGEIRKAAEGWRTHLDETPNARGYMYTTWLYGVSANFAFLEDFADVWTTVKPYEPTVSGSLPKKIMSFNVRAGYGDTPRYGIPTNDPCAHLEECAAVIRRERPDWCAIQEVDILAARSAKVDQVHELARRTGLFPVFGQTIKHAGGEAAGAYGVMTLSRERPIRYSVVPLADKTEDRVLLVTEFDRYIAVATHFSLHSECAIDAAKKVNELFAKSGKPVFFAGDLNSTPDSDAIAELKKGFVALSDVTKATWPTDAPAGEKARTIDWIFVDKAHAAQFADAHAEVLPDAQASDHFPITVTFGRRPE